jgi:hypothetical protein
MKAAVFFHRQSSSFATQGLRGVQWCRTVVDEKIDLL